jgi:molybdopterin converting factor small subunit
VDITVKLYGTLRAHRPASVGGAPHHPFTVQLPEGATLSYLREQLGIPEEHVNAAAVNREAAEDDAVLTDGDQVRLFPPAAGGESLTVFLAGIMQGSRRDHLIDDQDYRTMITEALHAHVPGVKVVDPFALDPGSVDYEHERARRTFETNTALAAETDVLIAYLPYASMGTAIEMWTAYQAGKYIVAVTPLEHNWAVKVTANEVLPDLESLLAAIESGRFPPPAAGD